MKRFEKLSSAEIVALMEQCNKAHYDLADCPIGKGNLGVCPDDCLLTWLKSDVQLVPRWQTAKTDDDIRLMIRDYINMCHEHNCVDCNYRNGHAQWCIANYLTEGVNK